MTHTTHYRRLQTDRGWFGYFKPSIVLASLGPCEAWIRARSGHASIRRTTVHYYSQNYGYEAI
jgi:hypothetical protein